MAKSPILRIYIPDASALAAWASGRRVGHSWDQATHRFAGQSYCRSLRDARDACDRLRELHGHTQAYAVHVERQDGTITTELL